MPIPPEEYGLESNTSYVTYAQVQKCHTPEECRRFCKWMNGQTTMSFKNGETGVYVCDYERWLREGCKIEQNADTWD